jgi:hypothetical protein
MVLVCATARRAGPHLITPGLDPGVFFPCGDEEDSRIKSGHGEVLAFIALERLFVGINKHARVMVTAYCDSAPRAVVRWRL